MKQYSKYSWLRIRAESERIYPSEGRGGDKRRNQEQRRGGQRKVQIYELAS
jgi:hypothetical protein